MASEGPANNVTRLRRGREVPFVPQLTPTDCGAACLASVLAFHDKHVPIHEIRSLLGGGRNGVNGRQLVSTGSVLHWDLQHFVVFERFSAKHVTLIDPAIGRRRLPLEQCAKSLSGAAFLFEPGESFVRQRPERAGRLRRYAHWILGIRGLWGRIAVTSFCLQLLALALALPGLTAILVDKVVPRGDVSLLGLVSAGFWC